MLKGIKRWLKLRRWRKIQHMEFPMINRLHPGMVVGIISPQGDLTYLYEDYFKIEVIKPNGRYTLRRIRTPREEKQDG